MRTHFLSSFELEQQNITTTSDLTSLPYHNLIDTRQDWPTIKNQLENRLSRQKSEYLEKAKKKIDTRVSERTLYEFKTVDTHFEVTYALERNITIQSIQREEVAALNNSFDKLNKETFSDLAKLQGSLFNLIDDLTYDAYKKKMEKTEALLCKCYQLLRSHPVSDNESPEKRYKENWQIFHKYKIILDSVILTAFQEQSRWSCGLFCSKKTTLGVQLQLFINKSKDGHIIRKTFFQNQSSLTYNEICASIIHAEYSSQKPSIFFNASLREENFERLDKKLSALEKSPAESLGTHLTHGYGAI